MCFGSFKKTVAGVPPLAMWFYSLLAKRYSTESSPPSTATAIMTIGMIPAML